MPLEALYHEAYAHYNEQLTRTLARPRYHTAVDRFLRIYGRRVPELERELDPRHRETSYVLNPADKTVCVRLLPLLK